jgi:putative transposase
MVGLMPTEQATRRGRHVVHALHVHLVFVTKYRRHVLDARAHTALRGIFAKVAADFGATLIEANGEDDHVHLLIAYPPAVAVSALVNSLKGVSSRLLRKTRPDLVRRYHRGALWSPSYFAASCGGAPLTVIRQYIAQQQAAS